jgi:hypothetical protein
MSSFVVELLNVDRQEFWKQPHCLASSVTNASRENVWNKRYHASSYDLWYVRNSILTAVYQGWLYLIGLQFRICHSR